MKSTLKKSISTEKHPSTILSLDQTGTFLCGLYELSSTGGYRSGAIVMYDIEGAMRHSLNFDAGVLDIKLSNSHKLLATALSNSSISIINFNNHENNSNHSIFGANTNTTIELPDVGLVLSACWDDAKFQKTHPKVIVSTQNSSIHTYQVGEGQYDSISIISNTHQLFSENVPIWIVAFDLHEDHVFASGGDDSCMKLWDERTGSSPIMSNKKSHNAGVTSIDWHPSYQHVFLSGSYDQHVRIWDIRKFTEPLNQIPLDGGVWRAKWHVSENTNVNALSSSFIVAACMQGGSSVIEFPSSPSSTLYDESEISSKTFSDPELLKKSIQGHDTQLVYGIDILLVINNASSINDEEKINNTNSNLLTIASCSFYENIIEIWDVCI